MQHINPTRMGSCAKALAPAAMAMCMSMAAGHASAQGAEIFKDLSPADYVHGETLIKQHQCTECHARKMNGDGAAIYRPDGRINSAPLLRGMVEQCNSTLNLQLWPEDVNAVAGVLNRDHYKFK
ncbi:hypothetical protein [Hydrogenophaga sp. 5NK40-0174]|uniref:hypothetical protein n=1 Tax=Hydrogenophaga sp. 5NK40-0174 TaxID=3127649 RepID=UPI003105D469